MPEKQITLEQELEQTAGLKKAKTESRPNYLKRVVAAIADVPEADWNALSKPAKKWYDDQVTRIDKGAEPEEIPGHVDVADDEEAKMADKKKAEPVKDQPAASRKAAKPKVAAKKAAKVAKPKVAVKKAAKPKAAPKRAVAATAPAASNGHAPAKTKTPKRKIMKVKGMTMAQAIRSTTLKKFSMSEEDMLAKLKPDYPTITIGTVSTGRATTRAVVSELLRMNALVPEFRDKFSSAA